LYMEARNFNAEKIEQQSILDSMTHTNNTPEPHKPRRLPTLKNRGWQSQLNLTRFHRYD
jgi:hypothetical protein